MSGSDDPIGAEAGGDGAPLAGRVLGHAMWAPDGRAPADFCAVALGAKVRQVYPDERGGESACGFTEGGAMYLFYTSTSFTAPDWPADELPFHLDLVFPDRAKAEERLLALGASKPAHQPGGAQWAVLLDLSGQPLCIHGAP